MNKDEYWRMIIAFDNFSVLTVPTDISCKISLLKYYFRAEYLTLDSFLAFSTLRESSRIVANSI